jgi:NAD(P)-dependent dehydrogenase (short-subunit alcohol dehydrogenase family)
MPAFDLSGRVAVVTGGNGGIGFGIASALGTAGAAVAVWGRDEAKTERAVRRLADQGIVAAGMRCDVSDEGDVARCTAETVGRFGRLDVSVANAGAGSHIPFIETTLAQWRRGLDTNLSGAFLCFREAAKQMVEGGEGGSLIAVSSVASRHAAPMMAGYAAAKAGLGGLVRSLAAELAPHRIRCNVLIPGFTENERLQADTVPTEYDIEVVSSVPAGRWGTPDDLGQAALYLADPSLSYHTGGEVIVDGAYSIMPPYLAVRSARENRRTGPAGPGQKE